MWRDDIISIVDTGGVRHHQLAAIYLGTAEAQANAFHVLLLRLPEGDEWHSKSDAFAAFGDLTNDTVWGNIGSGLGRSNR